MSNRPHSIATASQLPDDTIVDVVGRLDSVQNKTDKKQNTYYSMKISDGGEVLFANAWVKWTPEPLIGKTVILRKAKLGSYNGKRNVMLGKFSDVEEFSEDMDAPPQKAPQNRPPAQTGSQYAPAPQTPVKATGTARLNEYAALYAACLDAASGVMDAKGLSDQDRETQRNIATAFFIQALRENVKVEVGESGSVPF